MISRNGIPSKECVKPLSFRHQSFCHFVEVRHDEWPDSHNVSDKLIQRWSLKLICDDGAAEIRLRYDPITMFYLFETVIVEFGHWERVQAAEHWWSHLLKSSLQQQQINDWVLKQPPCVPTAHVFCICLSKLSEPLEMATADAVLPLVA